MSRSRRKPAKRGADRRPTTARSSELDPHLRRLEGDAGALLDTLVAAAMLLDATHRLVGTVVDAGLAPSEGRLAGAFEELPPAPLDVLSAEVAFMAPLANPVRAAAAALVAHALGEAHDDAAAAAMRSARDELDAALAAVRETIPIAIPAVPRTRRRAVERDALGRVAALIREQGLEAAAADVLLGTEHGGGRVLVTALVPDDTALVWLLESLYQRLELAAVADPLLLLERRASRWRFACWGGAARLRVDGDAFGRTVREQEYSFVERPTMALGAPVVVAAIDQPWFAAVPSRQRRLARLLADSFAGVFTVRARHGATVELWDPAGDTRYVVHEHNPDIRYEPGFLALGRLVPLGEGRWLRSPGMTFLSTRDDTLASELAHNLATVTNDLPRALAIEGIIATLASPKPPELPQPLPPATSRAEAHDVLFELSTLLRDTGFATQIARRSAPAELRELATGAGTQLLEFKVDPDVGEWMSALSRQAGIVPQGGRDR